MNELVSIIVPVFNVEYYLKRCIDSILGQSYPNFELILVNDGSTDNSYSICSSFQQKDHRIVVVDKENGGLSSARNAGIDIAKGTFITFIDSDDYVHPDYLKSMMEIILKQQCDMVYCSFKKFTDDEHVTDEGNKTISVFNGINCYENLFSETPEKLIVSWGKIYRREIFTDLRFKEGFIHEDEFIIHHVLSKCEKIAYYDYTLYYYYQRMGSIMNNGFNIRRLDRLDALVDRYEMLKDTKYRNDSILRILNDCVYFWNLIDKNDYRSKSKISDVYKRFYKLSKKGLDKISIGYFLFRLSPSIYHFVVGR